MEPKKTSKFDRAIAFAGFVLVGAGMTCAGGRNEENVAGGALAIAGSALLLMTETGRSMVGGMFPHLAPDVELEVSPDGTGLRGTNPNGVKNTLRS